MPAEPNTGNEPNVPGQFNVDVPTESNVASAPTSPAAAPVSSAPDFLAPQHNEPPVIPSQPVSPQEDLADAAHTNPQSDSDSATRSTFPSVAAPPAPDADAPGVPAGSVDVPLSPSTRRFLEPIVGIDLGSVQVHQAPHGAPATQGADAVTFGNDIVLAAGQAGESPRALGLLAHELTHVAHEREASATAGDAAAVSAAPAHARAGVLGEASRVDGMLGTTVSEGGQDSTPAEIALNPAAQAGAPAVSDATASTQFTEGPGAASEEPPTRGARSATLNVDAGPTAAVVDDEAGARRVEAFAIAAAESAAGLFAESAPGSLARPFAPPTSDLAAASFAASAHAAASVQPGTTSQAPAAEPVAPDQLSHPEAPPWNLEPTANAEPDPWGGLPAPWEPLPAWLAGPSAFVTTSDVAGLNNASGSSFDADRQPTAGAYAAAGLGNGGGSLDGGSGNSGGSSGGSGDAGGGAGGSGGTAHFADTGRPLEVPPASAASPAAGQPPAVEPDLDALAQQVYTILKRRLASERRRLT
jgi:hypothetical protein